MQNKVQGIDPGIRILLLFITFEIFSCHGHPSGLLFAVFEHHD